MIQILFVILNKNFETNSVLFNASFISLWHPDQTAETSSNNTTTESSTKKNQKTSHNLDDEL